MGKNLVEIICAKDEQSAKLAAEEFIDICDIELFKKLCDKMEFLFDFVRENVYKRLDLAINKDNFKNIICFFDTYSSYFDDFFASELAKYADEDLTDEILEILCNGNENQKAYAAAYFSKIPDTVAMQDLQNCLETDFEPLFINCSTALGKMHDNESLERYKQLLNIDDEFTKLKAVKFIVYYGNKNDIEPLINAMTKSSMPENIAGEIINLISPIEIFKNNFHNGALVFNNIINGLGEILPLENIFYYEIYDVINFLFNNKNIPESILLLFNLKNKFDIITENEEYIFDLDKNTKNEIFEIKNILNSNNFWDENKIHIKKFLKDDNPFLETAIEIIKDNCIYDFTKELCELTQSKNETVICEALSALKALNKINCVDKNNINIKNENLKAIAEQLFL